MPFNSLYEILQEDFIVPLVHVAYPFNSLYEILGLTKPMPTYIFTTFNSLYEIPGGNRELATLHLRLSILSMRFLEDGSRVYTHRKCLAFNSLYEILCGLSADGYADALLFQFSL